MYRSSPPLSVVRRHVFNYTSKDVLTKQTSHEVLVRCRYYLNMNCHARNIAFLSYTLCLLYSEKLLEFITISLCKSFNACRFTTVAKQRLWLHFLPSIKKNSTGVCSLINCTGVQVCCYNMPELHCLKNICCGRACMFQWLELILHDSKTCKTLILRWIVLFWFFWCEPFLIANNNYNLYQANKSFW